MANDLDRLIGGLETYSKTHEKRIESLDKAVDGLLQAVGNHSGQLKVLNRIIYGIVAVVILTVLRELVEAGILG